MPAHSGALAQRLRTSALAFLVATRCKVRAKASGLSFVPSSRAILMNASDCSAGVIRLRFLVAMRGGFLMTKRPELSKEVLDKVAALLRDWLIYYEADPKPELKVAREVGRIMVAYLASKKANSNL